MYGRVTCRPENLPCARGTVDVDTSMHGTGMIWVRLGDMHKNHLTRLSLFVYTKKETKMSRTYIQ
jgi:hypothetical protein